jgi:hypothetical protein
MTAMWGVHNDHPELDLIGNGFISVGWDDVGDLTLVGSDKEAMKQKVAAMRPNAKPTSSMSYQSKSIIRTDGSASPTSRASTTAPGRTSRARPASTRARARAAGTATSGSGPSSPADPCTKRRQ